MVTMPVEKDFYVTSGFGPRWGQIHYGTDFGAPGGSGGRPIYAVKDGTVARSGPATGFGQWVGIDHPASNGGGETIYGHIIPEVTVGQQVREGQRIGRINPDRTTNGGVDPHLHLEWHRYQWVPPGPDRLDPMTMLKGAKSPGAAPAPAPAPAPAARATVIDFSAAVPPADAVKNAGHVGAVRYISPAREEWMKAKPARKADVDAYRSAGLDTAFVWQYGAGGALTSDVMRGRAGGIADAKLAQRYLNEAGCPNHPVFMSVDFNITLTEWNAVAVDYFRAACEVLGRDRVGIYGHTRVCDWAREDGVIADVGEGKHLMWQTRSWVNAPGAKVKLPPDYVHPLAVLYQRVIDTPKNPGPKVGGVTVDINDILHHYWGQKPPSTGDTPGTPPNVTVTKPKEEKVETADLKKYITVQPDYVKLLQKHFTPGRGGRKIKFIVRHHLAGVGTTDDVWNWWQNRQASAHYVIENGGRVGQLVWDRDTAWANANAVINQESIAIEHANHAGSAQDWPIADEVIIGGARWAAALCLFYGLGKPEFGKNIRDHREFGQTSCPHHLANGGKYHQKWMDEARRFYDVLVAAKAGNVTAPAAPPPAPTTPPPAPLPSQQDVLNLILDQIAGPRDEQGRQGFKGWPQLNGLTLVDAVAAIGEHLKMEGFGHRPPPTPEDTK